MAAKKKDKKRPSRERSRKAMGALLDAAGHLQRCLDEECMSRGITYDQYNVLGILQECHPEGYPRYEISSRLAARAPDVTRLLDRLEKNGYVERFKSKNDARLSLAMITEEGLKLLDDLNGPILAVHDRFAAGLKKKELKALTKMIEVVIPN